MAFSPALFKDFFDIVWMEAHVHRLVRVVNVADLALSPDINGMSSEKTKAVLLKSRCSYAHSFGACLAQILDSLPQIRIAVRGA